ncbi:hypothetical protein AgCh_022751 [Apium graveolens]
MNLLFVVHKGSKEQMFKLLEDNKVSLNILAMNNLRIWFYREDQEIMLLYRIERGAMMEVTKKIMPAKPYHPRNINGIGTSKSANVNPYALSGVDKCYRCGEPGHKSNQCPRRARVGLATHDEDDNYDIPNEVDEDENEITYEDEGISLVLRKLLYTPQHELYDQKHNIFTTKCTVKDRVCDLIIDSGSSDNIVSSLMVKKLNLPTENHPNPYSLGWIRDVGEVKGAKEIGKLYALVIKGETPGSAKYPSKVQPILDEFASLVPDGLPESLPPMRDIQHHIDLQPGVSLPNLPHYTMSSKEHAILQEQVDDLLKKGFIKPSMSPCTVPALLTPQKDESWRMCIDSRAINNITIRYRFPIPRSDYMLDMLDGSKVFSKIDLKSGYNQIRIRLGDEWKIAFKIKDGLYEWYVMPFGLSNAPRTFMRIMNQKFTFVIKHKSGKHNNVADALSRHACMFVIMHNEVVGFEYLKDLYADDEDFGGTWCKAIKGEHDTDFNLQDGFLFKGSRLYDLAISKSFNVKDLFTYHHDKTLVDSSSLNSRASFSKDEGTNAEQLAIEYLEKEDRKKRK